MGFCEDAVVRLVTAGGNIICELYHSRYGLKREVANNIFVSVVD
jgi:Fe2+ transport system protein FeoA